ncbi:MAG: NAD(P)H-dependent oxidoreductase, partial [Pyrinomonadaceae bacterium]|nr:NAD(P)H-dependent oxidoreductase [Pyrinomonadaceae bacterium]
MSETATKTGESTVSNETITSQLNWRYAVKKFDATKKVSDADFQILQDSLVLSPASYGLQ